MRGEKTLLNLRITASEMFVRGDTFENRGILKHMGFRWEPSVQAWHRPVTEIPTLNYIISMLKVNNIQYEHDHTIKHVKILSVDELMEFRSKLNKMKESIC